jgi:hypothetical protein
VVFRRQAFEGECHAAMVLLQVNGGSGAQTWQLNRKGRHIVIDRWD